MSFRWKIRNPSSVVSRRIFHLNCPHCEDGTVWIRVEIDHELPAPCPECEGTGEVLELEEVELADAASSRAA